MAEKDTDPLSRGELLRLDYEQTGLNYKMLADVRFKLLALVPTLAGAAVAAGTTMPPATAAGVSILGLFSMFGVTLYDLRNTQLYYAARERLAGLEAELRFPCLDESGKECGGVQLSRPPQKRTFLRQVVHHRALGLIYGSSLAGWAFLFGQSVARAVAAQSSNHPGLLNFAITFGPFILAGIVFVPVCLGYRAFDKAVNPDSK